MYVESPITKVGNKVKVDITLEIRQDKSQSIV